MEQNLENFNRQSARVATVIYHLVWSFFEVVMLCQDSEKGELGIVAGVLWGSRRWPPPVCLWLWSLVTLSLEQ